MQVLQHLLLAIAVYQVLGKHLNEVYNKEDYVCFEQLNVKRERIAKIFDKDYKVKIDDPFTNEYGVCWLKLMGMLDDNDKLKWDTLVPLGMTFLELYDIEGKKEEISASIINACKNIVDAKSEYIIGILNNCIVDQIHLNYTTDSCLKSR
ncbi:uncharacterized protein LOC116182305 [Photinus pyralis]|uniref:uncharacterized protein LOC116182305 n=1 Tax=Photinus pyralis TaxID=7054 RepID=UPI0012673AD8|nr:uncharacterized protein LOC116182305 [Photinus pyralis]